MMPIAPTQDLQVRQLLRQCGQQAKRMARQTFEVSQKGPEDYVTTVDRLLDQQLAVALTEIFPGVGCISEENDASRQGFQQQHDRLCLIDPLDGTEDFIQGNGGYSCMVGLLQHYQPIAGWIYAPERDELYFGGAHWGLFQTSGEQSPQPLAPLEPPPPSLQACPVQIGHRDLSNFGAAITAEIPEIQFHTLGSFGLKVLEVILGRVGLYMYFNGRVKLWDTTASLALAQAAGLVCCDLDGQPLRSTPDSIELETLIHTQSILIGWPSYIEALRPRLQQAIGRTVLMSQR